MEGEIVKIIETVNSTDLNTEEALCDLRQAIEDGRTVHVKIISDLDMKNIRKKWNDQVNPSEICMPRIKIDPKEIGNIESDDSDDDFYSMCSDDEMSKIHFLLKKEKSQREIARELFETNMKKYKGKTLAKIEKEGKMREFGNEIDKVSVLETKKGEKLEEKNKWYLASEMKKYEGQTLAEIEEKGEKDNFINEINRISMIERENKKLKERIEELEKENSRLKFQVENNDNECNSIICNFEDVIRSIGDKKEELEKENIALKNMINHMKNCTE